MIESMDSGAAAPGQPVALSEDMQKKVRLPLRDLHKALTSVQLGSFD